MTIEEKISELNRRMSAIDSLTVSSLDEIKMQSRQKASRQEVQKSAARIRQSVIRYCHELESRA